MRNKLIFHLTALLLFLFVSSGHGAWYQSGGKSEKNLFLSGNLGFNSLSKGYPGYSNYFSLGADLYIVPEPKISALLPSWKDNFFYRVSVDYFPLIVPDGTYNTNEDIFGLSGDILYSIYKSKKKKLFAGVGLGGYFDWVRVDTPATGSRSATYWFFGLKPSLGYAIRVSPDIELIPEIRAHFIWTANDYFATNTVYQIGVCYQIK